MPLIKLTRTLSQKMLDAILLGMLLISISLAPPALAEDEDFLLLSIPAIISGVNKLHTEGGVFIHRGKALVGFGACADIWKYQGCPNITRGTETSNGSIHWDDDIEKMVQNYVDHHFSLIPTYEGLWQDSGSYDHAIECNDSYGKTQVYALPYARSNIGIACDGRRKFDLSKFNQAFFDRYAQLAAVAQKKGILVNIALFNQHRYLETNAHYQDQPWRPQNNINIVSMPSHVPAANSFYKNETNRHHQRKYIRKMLDTIAPYRDFVLLSLAEEYTGGIGFMNFFMDTVRAWETDKGLARGSIHISLAAPKNVLDLILATRSHDIFAINLRYFFYRNGVLYQPSGGIEVPGRYSIGVKSFDGAANSSAAKIHQKTLSYRLRYPDKIILDQIQANTDQSWAFFMAKGSILVQQQVDFPGPGQYGRPKQAGVSKALSVVRGLVRQNYASLLPSDHLISGHNNWCLSAKNKAYVAYSMNGGKFNLDLQNDTQQYTASWVNPENGSTIKAGTISGGGVQAFSTPGNQRYVLVLN